MVVHLLLLKCSMLNHVVKKLLSQLKMVRHIFLQELGLLRDDGHQRQQPQPGGRDQGAVGKSRSGQRRDRPLEEDHREADRRASR